MEVKENIISSISKLETFQSSVSGPRPVFTDLNWRGS